MHTDELFSVQGLLFHNFAETICCNTP